MLGYKLKLCVLAFRIRQRGLHGQADSDAQKPISGAAEDGRAEEERRHGHGHAHCSAQQRRSGPARHAQADGKVKKKNYGL